MNATPLYFALGRPFSPLYSMAMRIREFLYRRHLLASYAFSCPVLSVGNLTMGGSGKTPMVQYLARELKLRGFHPAIISRGYGGKAMGRCNIVSDGTSLLLPATEAGDEPRFLAETLQGVPVLTGIVRRFSAQQAIDMGADVLLLDDGFQHLQIRRDVNLALFNTDRLAGNSRVFPGGDLREPVVALQRATGFVMTGVREDNRDRAERFGSLLQSRFPDINVHYAGYSPAGVVMLAEDGRLVVSNFDPCGDTPWFGFAGIAHPESFQQSLAAYGVSLAGFHALDDHQRYTPELLRKLAHQAISAGACGLITTEKDLVKLAPCLEDRSLPLFGLRMEVTMDSSLVEEIVAAITPAEHRAESR